MNIKIDSSIGNVSINNLITRIKSEINISGRDAGNRLAGLSGLLRPELLHSELERYLP